MMTTAVMVMMTTAVMMMTTAVMVMMTTVVMEMMTTVVSKILQIRCTPAAVLRRPFEKLFCILFYCMIQPDN